MRIMNSTKESMGFFPRNDGFRRANEDRAYFQNDVLEGNKKALKSQIERWAGLSGSYA